jgi:peroxiredoxin
MPQDERSEAKFWLKYFTLVRISPILHVEFHTTGDIRMQGRTGKTVQTSLSAVCAILLLCASAGAQSDPWKELYVLRLDGAKEAYDFALRDMQGKSRQLEDFRGNLVLLTFWASFCPPCVEEMPSLNRLHRKWREKGLVVLGVSLDETRDRVEAYLRKVEIEFPVLWDEHLEVGKRYRVFALPMTYIIDRRGNLIGVAMGARPWDSPAAHALIGSLLEASQG